MIDPLARRSSRRSYARVDDRRAEILLAAHELFLEHGYAETTTDAIVARSGGSKQTVYALFGNKAGLFRAVVEAAAASVLSAFAAPTLDPADPVGALRTIGIVCLETWIAPRNLGIVRLVIAEAPKVPEIRDALMRFGMKAPEVALVAFLRRCTAAGTLTVPAPEAFARVFLSLATRPVLPSLITMTPLSKRDIHKHVDAIVPTCLLLCDDRVDPARLEATS